MKTIFIFLFLTMIIYGEAKKHQGNKDEKNNINNVITNIVEKSTLSNSPIPNLPPIDIKHDGSNLTCYPIKMIKQKYHKERVQYYCISRNIKISDNDTVDNIDKDHGQVGTEKLIEAVKDKADQGNTYKVDILLSDAKKSSWAGFFLKRELKEGGSLSRIINILLPAKYYISFRPQLANNGDQKGFKFRDAGSRGGFFYYKKFRNELEIMFQYEAGISFNSDVPFINISDGDNSSRRLSYASMMYQDYSVVVGKYWSAYYDVAGFTDNYMAFGAQSSGAFNNSTDGSESGTGRPDRVVQIKTKQDQYNINLQYQPMHPSTGNIDSDYSYGIAGSLVYKYSDFIRVGTSISYARFEDITPSMNAIGIDGDDQSYIVGFTYMKDKYSINSTLSYTRNHMNDDMGYYFDSIGAELYLRYKINDSVRIVGGGNWMIPTDDSYLGKYRIRTNILSLQYTFGNKTYDDLIYIEASSPRGRLANGD